MNRKAKLVQMRRVDPDVGNEMWLYEITPPFKPSELRNTELADQHMSLFGYGLPKSPVRHLLVSVQKSESGVTGLRPPHTVIFPADASGRRVWMYGIGREYYRTTNPLAALVAAGLEVISE